MAWSDLVLGEDDMDEVEKRASMTEKRWVWRGENRRKRNNGCGVVSVGRAKMTMKGVVF